MPKHYVTFGQTHVHSVNGKTFDKDTVAVFEAENDEEGRKKTRMYFDQWFFTDYHDKQWEEENLKYYPKGYVEV